MAGARTNVVLVSVAMLLVRCCSNIVVERRIGMTPDRFRLTASTCTPHSNCDSFGGEEDTGATNCQCQCTQSNNTFSTANLQCIKNVGECAESAIGNDDGRLFTFTIIDYRLYPSLPVREITSDETKEIECNKQRLTTEFEDRNSWFMLPSSVFTLTVKALTNDTYIQMERGNYSTLNGKLVKVTYQCVSEGQTTTKCIAFTMQGVQEVSLGQVQGVTEPSAQTSKLDVTIIYWVTGGCIGALAMGAIVSVTVVCLWKKREEKDPIKIDRIKEEDYRDGKRKTTKITRNSSVQNGGDRSRNVKSEIRQHKFKKNPQLNSNHRTSPRRNTDYSPRRTPRPPSQNSATFVVNEHERQTAHPSPTDGTQRQGTPPKKSILRLNAKEAQARAHSIRVARSALTEFEGQRVVPETSQQSELFNENRQRMSGINESLRGMGHRFNREENPSSKSSSKKKGKSSMSTELATSVWSIDYKHFDVPQDLEMSALQHERVVARGQLPSPRQPITSASSPRSTGFQSEISNEDNEHMLKEYNVEHSTIMSVEEFAGDVPITNIDDLEQTEEIQPAHDDKMQTHTSTPEKSSGWGSDKSLTVTFHNVVADEETESKHVDTQSQHLSDTDSEDRTLSIRKRSTSGLSDVNAQDFNIPITNIDELTDSSFLPQNPESFRFSLVSVTDTSVSSTDVSGTDSSNSSTNFNGKSIALQSIDFPSSNTFDDGDTKL